MSLRTKTFSSILLAFAALGLAACDRGTAQAPPSPPPPSVAVMAVEAQSVPLRFQYAGRVAAFREVEIRARVPGILLEKSFVEGAAVKEGDVLFRIDPATYEVELARARAQRQEAQAQVDRTRRDAERTLTLFQRQASSEKARDDAVAAHELAKATLAGAEAAVRAAEINLSYTTIKAPIPGIASLRVVPEGSLVGTNANDSLLTRISQIEQVYVHFSFTDAEANEIRDLIGGGDSKNLANGNLQAKISLGDGKSYPLAGRVDFTDSSVDLQTGTVRARAVVPNLESILRPGQFVRVSVEGITRHDTIVVPQAAVMQGPQGQFVYAVDVENKASIRPISLGREVANGWIVEKGLKAGDRIITEGVIKVRPGAPVTVAAQSDKPIKAAQR
jgi:membrane fusion protein (multidrug efflux system)